MQKLFKSLPFRLLVGVVAGMVLGLVANEDVMNVVVTVKQVLGQLITFCVPQFCEGRGYKPNHNQGNAEG